MRRNRRIRVHGSAILQVVTEETEPKAMLVTWVRPRRPCERPYRVGSAQRHGKYRPGPKVMQIEFNYIGQPTLMIGLTLRVVGDK